MPGLHAVLRKLAPLATIVLVACGGAHKSVPPVGTQPPDGGTSVTPPDTDGGVPPPGDAGAPVVPSLGGLSTGAVVAGHVALNASVPADTSRVDFQLDGTVFATVTAAPFSTTWNSFDTANGAHTLGIRATGAAGVATNSPPTPVTLQNHISHVFVIVMENEDWGAIKGSSAAPYINQVMLAQGAHAERYMNVPGLHPSLPNYLWLESGATQGVADDDVPANHRLATTRHLTTLLNDAGITWKSYQEDVPGTNCPLDYVNQYVPRHDPMVYFTDVTGGLDWNNAYCISHVRPYGELAKDLETNTVPAYSFITPNICNDMHDCGIAAGDAWLSREVPKILGSKAFQEGGALFLTWDESGGSDVPIGLVVMSPMARAGYTNSLSYTHSSTLRSLQEIFGVNAQYLGDAANATDLRDLFKTFP